MNANRARIPYPHPKYFFVTRGPHTKRKTTDYNLKHYSSYGVWVPDVPPYKDLPDFVDLRAQASESWKNKPTKRSSCPGLQFQICQYSVCPLHRREAQWTQCTCTLAISRWNCRTWTPTSSKIQRYLQYVTLLLSCTAHACMLYREQSVAGIIFGRGIFLGSTSSAWADRNHWLIQLVNREGVWLWRPY